eukprot:scaffold330133_cov67-Tisochrysis_lutea.AAC.3
MGGRERARASENPRESERARLRHARGREGERASAAGLGRLRERAVSATSPSLLVELLIARSLTRSTLWQTPDFRLSRFFW